MKEDFIIHIKSRSEQFEHTQPVRVDEDDRIELMTYGSFVKKGDTYYITYKETETIGFAGCTTTIKIAADGSRVGLLRFGPANAHPDAGRDRRRHRVQPDRNGRHGPIQLSAGRRRPHLQHQPQHTGNFRAKAKLKRFTLSVRAFECNVSLGC